MQIAIVEDTPINLILMQSLVRRLDGTLESTVFSDPVIGLEWTLENRPDLIIVDYMMPGLDGLEFIRRCRACEALRDRPILMVTAASDREVRYAALEAGATDFLTKPIDRNEFNPRVRNMLALRASMAATSSRADELARNVEEALREVHLRERETVLHLARAAEFRDPETGSHISRMSHYAALIARRLGMSEHDINILLLAAPMHDVGKLGTPDHILLKPGKLDDDELRIMRQHAEIGYEILKNSSSQVLQMAADIALHHHERFDGKGYPRGSKGDEIPLIGRIVAVADVFDALTSARPYKAAWPLEKARDYLIEERGRHFDPECVDRFLEGWDDILEIRRLYAD